jgi:hypothetical protein
MKVGICERLWGNCPVFRAAVIYLVMLSQAEFLYGIEGEVVIFTLQQT